MASATDNLRRILQLERDQGCHDTAVLGGLEGFLARWQERLPTESQDRNPPDDAGEVVAPLAGYASMSPVRRRRAVEDVLARLSKPVRKREQAALREAPAAEPATTGSRARQPASRRNGGHRVPDASQITLTSPVTCIKGVSTAYQARLARLGVHTIQDLLYHLPRRYDDYSALKTIDRLELGDEVTIVGTVRDARAVRSRRGRPFVRATVTDGTGVISATWFGQPYLVQTIKPGTDIVLSGRVDQYLGRLVFTSPEWEPLQRELLHTGRLVPLYPLTEGITARRLRGLVHSALDQWADRIVDPVPPEVVESASLMGIGEALRQIHFPDSEEALRQARRRLVFDEFLLLQLGVLRQRGAWREREGLPLDPSRAELDAFLGALPFSLTGAQDRALQAILEDLQQPTPMRRLLQGDVGSGKTVVAAAAILVAVRNDLQAAVMVPTGILAEQHYQTICGMLSCCPNVRCEMLVGGLPAAERQRLREAAAAGETDVLVGTHALIQEGVELPRLGLVVVDEQHRFGVKQRASLAERGTTTPHMLAMSATPIPRSLAMTIYGDLDITVLDELPPGRQEVITGVREERSRERIYAFVEAQIQEGRQAFVVCPLIDESDDTEARAATAEYERLSRTVFAHLRLALLHGRMSDDQKDEVMAAFKRGDVDVLVSTTVIEVGIDVPNATVMLIENAERFGLAQLHQLRGRVGRGAHRAFCILMSADAGKTGAERLRIMEETTDGFVLAEQDLRLRGPGDFIGVRQHGLPSLKVAQLSDSATLEVARREALRLFERDAELASPEHRELALSVQRFWAQDQVGS